MNKAKVLLMAIGAIGIAGGAIAAKAKNHFSALRCSISSNASCSSLTPGYTHYSLGSAKFCDVATSGKCTVFTKVIVD